MDSLRRLPSPAPTEASGWLACLILALVWSVGPALPALTRGELIGQPYTDLYPSVWGMWWFAGQQPGLPTLCAQLGAPNGMAFYYSSPLHGWLAWPLLPLLGLPATFNLTVLLARAATVLCAFGAARAWGLERRGALLAAVVYGASPFFQGYAVEGIIEGTDGWTLALWLWMLGRDRLSLASLAFALTVLSSWYLAAAACVLAVFTGPRGWLSMVGGLALSAPALWSFLGAFPAREDLDSGTRAAMGLSLGLRPPGILPELQPFAMTTWVGLVAPLLALSGLRQADRRQWVSVALLACMVLLSTGWGPWFQLPPFSALRFPYRFHAGTLVALAYLAGRAASRRGPWLAWVVLAEGLLLSPIEPLLPSSPSEVAPIYRNLPPAKVLLDIPGPIAMPPGEINLSRPRARWFLYAQTVHGLASPWVPDFNGVGVAASDPLDSVRALDPLSKAPLPEILTLPEDVDLVVLHRRELHGRAEDAARLLSAAGFETLADDGERSLWARAQRGSR